jgi:hypothetical protein
VTDFDDLRSEFDDDLGLVEDDDDFEADRSATNANTLFLGMTPVERMFISIFLFLNVAVLGIALLLATGRMG